MKYIILVLGCILLVYEIVTLIIAVVKKRKEKQKEKNGQSEDLVDPEEDKEN